METERENQGPVGMSRKGERGTTERERERKRERERERENDAHCNKVSE